MESTTSVNWIVFKAVQRMMTCKYMYEEQILAALESVAGPNLSAEEKIAARLKLEEAWENIKTYERSRYG